MSIAFQNVSYICLIQVSAFLFGITLSLLVYFFVLDKSGKYSKEYTRI